jgi:hypothetical protein
MSIKTMYNPKESSNGTQKHIVTVDTIESDLAYFESHRQDPWYNLQINVIDNADDRSFTEYLISIADEHRCDELKSWHRETTDVSASEILELTTAESSLLSGIKLYYKSMMGLHSYQKWEGGYIEGFLRVSPKGKPDYFIWSFIRMDKLKDILTTFAGKLTYTKIVK